MCVSLGQREIWLIAGWGRGADVLLNEQAPSALHLQPHQHPGGRDIQSGHAQVSLTVVCWRVLHMADLMAAEGDWA